MKAESRTQTALLGAISWYQRLRPNKPSPCRFFPSCSEYSHEAIELHGAKRGSWLMLKRLSRCRPFGPFGFDPVPEISANPADGRSQFTNV